MHHFCTYFDRHYLLRGLTLYRSLHWHARPFMLWVLCLDDFSCEVLTRMDLPNLRPIALADLEQGDTELQGAKKNRSRIEYYFTCTPSWPLYLLNHYKEIDLITYLDADLFFYDSPEPIFAELGNNSILIIAHRFPPDRLEMESHGIYNVGIVSFRADAHGRECLEWWRERCLEWCYDRLEDGRFADQKYLDDWPTRFQGVVVLQHKGAGLAPWNWMNYHLEPADNGIIIDGQPLLFFHFHGLKIFNRWLYDPVAEGRFYGEMPRWLRWHLYPAYMQELKNTRHWVQSVAPEVDIEYNDIRTHNYGGRKWLRKIFEGRLIVDFTIQ